jgi:hypothetical protein
VSAIEGIEGDGDLLNRVPFRPAKPRRSAASPRISGEIRIDGEATLILSSGRALHSCFIFEGTIRETTVSWPTIGRLFPPRRGW